MKVRPFAYLSLALMLVGLTFATHARAQSADDEAPSPPSQDARDENREGAEQPQTDQTEIDADRGQQLDHDDEGSARTDQAEGQQPSAGAAQDDQQLQGDARERRRQESDSRQGGREGGRRDYDDLDNQTGAEEDLNQRDSETPDFDRGTGRDARGRVSADARGEINIQDAGDLGLDVREADNGLTIANIERNSFLVGSGFRTGDVIVSVQQRPVRSSRDFIRWFRTIDRQASIPVIVLRDGRRQTIYLTGADVWRWYDRTGWDNRGDSWDRGSRGQYPYLGVVFDDRYPRLAMVEVVRRNTAADRAELRPGDVITRINGQRVLGMRHATQLVSEMNPGDDIELEYSRRTTARANATLGSRPGGSQMASQEEYGGGWYSDEADDGDRYDDGATRTSYDEDAYPERTTRDGLLRRGVERPFRNP